MNWLRRRSASLYSKFSRVLCLQLCLCLTWPQSLPPAFSSDVFSPGSPEHFLSEASKGTLLPPGLGTIQETFNPAVQVKGDFPVVLIEDAHAVPGAQQAIEKIIVHLGERYEISETSAEGTSGTFDALLFRTFPFKRILGRVVDRYLADGELPGPAALAMRARKAVHVRGMEDMRLYEEDINAYLEAGKYREKLEAELMIIRGFLDSFKKAHYGPELLELDGALENFRSGADNLSSLAALMAQTGEANGMALREDYYPDLLALVKLVDVEEDVPSAVTHEISVLAGQVKTRLVEYAGKIEFNSRLQAYKTEQASAEDFLEYLMSAAQTKKIPLNLSSALKERLARHRKAGSIESARLFDELERYAGYLKTRLIITPEQEEAERLTRAVYLLSGLLAFKLSRNEWNGLRVLHEKGLASAKRSEAGLSDAAAKINSLLAAQEKRTAPYFQFYKIAEKREAAFFEHIRKAARPGRPAINVAVAGGFHTQGLAEILRRENIPHVIITPAILHLPERNHYFSHMQGQVSWRPYFAEEKGRISVRNAFNRAAAERLLTAAREEMGEQGLPIVIKKWRENIIAALVKEQRLTELQETTLALDEAAEKLSGVDEEKVRAAWIKKVEVFAAGLKELDAGVPAPEEKIAGLFRAPAAAAWSTAMLMTRNTAPAEWRRGAPALDLAATSPYRAELRTETVDLEELLKKMKRAIRMLEAAYDHPDLVSKRRNRKRIKDLSTSLGDTLSLVTSQGPEERRREILTRAQNDLKNAESLIKELRLPGAESLEQSAGTRIKGSTKSHVPEAGYIEGLIQAVIKTKSYPVKAEALLRIRSVSPAHAMAELQTIIHEQRPVEERIAAMLMLGLVGPSARETVSYLREIRRAKSSLQGRGVKGWQNLQEAAGWALGGILKSEWPSIPVHLLDLEAGGAASTAAAALQPLTPRRLEMTDAERFLSVLIGLEEDPEGQAEAVHSLAGLGTQTLDELILSAGSHPILQGRIGAILGLGSMREAASGALEKLEEIRADQSGDPVKFDKVRSAAAWAAASIRGETEEPAPYQLLRSELREPDEAAGMDPAEIRRQIFREPVLDFTNEVRDALLSLFPAPVLEQLNRTGISLDKIPWVIDRHWVAVPKERPDYFFQVDRSPDQRLVIAALVPFNVFPQGMLLTEYAPVYLPLQEGEDDQLKFAVGGRLNTDALAVDDENYTRNPIRYWLEKNLDPFSRRLGFKTHSMQPLGFPISALPPLGFQKTESGSYVRQVPAARSELRAASSRPEDDYDTVLRTLALSGTAPAGVRNAVPAVLTLIRKDGPQTAAGRLIERAGDPVYLKLYTGGDTDAAAEGYLALEDLRRRNSDYDNTAAAWTLAAIASLPAQAEAYFARMKQQGAQAKELNYSFAFPLDESPQVRDWILKFLDTIREMQANPVYGAHVRANIRVLVTRDELNDASLKDFFTAVGRSHSAKVLEITSVASAAVQIKGFLEQSPNALAYGVEDYPLSEENALRVVRSDVDVERTFPVAVLLAQRLAEAPGITPELLKNMTAQISAVVGFDGRGLHISTLAYEIALEYTVTQMIGRMA